jgi:hypothetical protein
MAASLSSTLGPGLLKVNIKNIAVLVHSRPRQWDRERIRTPESLTKMLHRPAKAKHDTGS